MRKTYKYRLYPTKNQIKWLEFNLEACRWVYNETLEVRKRAWEDHNITLGRYDTNKFIKTWRDQYPELKNVHSQIFQDVQFRVHEAYNGFFRRVKAGENPGYPRFKGKDRYNSFTCPQYQNSFWINYHILHISKIGDIRIKLHRQINGLPKTATISRYNSKWYVSIVARNGVNFIPDNELSVGIDVGLKTFATFSDGKTIENPKFFRADEKALAKAQRKMDKSAKGSSGWNKHKKVISHIHTRIFNRRHNFTHQISRQIVNEYGTICVEDLNIKQMLRNGFHGVNKSISDAAWNQFIMNISYKAEDAGRRFVMVDPAYTTQRCSKCNTLVPKTLDIRTHNCPVCGLVMDRDLNASINILALGLQSLVKPRSPVLNP